MMYNYNLDHRFDNNNKQNTNRKKATKQKLILKIYLYRKTKKYPIQFALAGGNIFCADTNSFCTSNNSPFAMSKASTLIKLSIASTYFFTVPHFNLDSRTHLRQLEMSDICLPH